MPPYPDPSIYFLNIEECYECMYELQKCLLENPYMRYLGKCNAPNSKVGKCLTKQRELRQMKNLQESRIRHKQMWERMERVQEEDSKIKMTQ